jgi:hypothetical protein
MATEANLLQEQIRAIRSETVTHVLGINCYLCLRNGPRLGNRARCSQGEGKVMGVAFLTPFGVTGNIMFKLYFSTQLCGLLLSGNPAAVLAVEYTH